MPKYFDHNLKKHELGVCQRLLFEAERTYFVKHTTRKVFEAKRNKKLVTLYDKNFAATNFFFST